MQDFNGDGPTGFWFDGTQYWSLNGKFHRENGPAVEYPNGTKWWYLNGKLHRTDGPAVEYSNGSKEWYLNGELLTEEEWQLKISLNNIFPLLSI